MIVKWVCEECSSNNMGEFSDSLCCSVCGKAPSLRTLEIFNGNKPHIETEASTSDETSRYQKKSILLIESIRINPFEFLFKWSDMGIRIISVIIVVGMGWTTYKIIKTSPTWLLYNIKTELLNTDLYNRLFHNLLNLYMSMNLLIPYCRNNMARNYTLLYKSIINDSIMFSNISNIISILVERVNNFLVNTWWFVNNDLSYLINANTNISNQGDKLLNKFHI